MLQKAFATKRPADAQAVSSSAETSGIYLAGSILSMATAMLFKHLGRKHPAFYIGEWVAPLLLMKLFSQWAQSASRTAGK